MNKWKSMWAVGAILTLTLIVVSCTPQLLESTADADSAKAETVAEDSETQDASTLEEVEFLPSQEPPFSTSNWTTDFSKRTVEWTEILSGGPPKDGIPSVDSPTFESLSEATDRIAAREPVIVFEHDGDVRGYPLSILIWHEIVNDEVGGKPVSITFCPLCNASIVFDREFDGEIRDFGTTGKLRNSDLIMYDRQSETWWQQFTGTGIVGEYAGQQLTFLPSQVLSYGDFAERFPDAQVMAVPDFNRRYGANPYQGYDSTTNPFLFDGEIDPRLPATERVVGVDVGEAVKAYSFTDAADAQAINDTLGDTSLVVFHKAGTASALDSSTISEGKDIGSVGVFSRDVDGQELTFEANGDGTFSDAETGSTWDITGTAVDGELAGTRLGSVLSFDHFWFAWAAFNPDTELWEG